MFLGHKTVYTWHFAASAETKNPSVLGNTFFHCSNLGNFMMYIEVEWFWLIWILVYLLSTKAESLASTDLVHPQFFTTWLEVHPQFFITCKYISSPSQIFITCSVTVHQRQHLYRLCPTSYPTSLLAASCFASLI